VSGTICRRGGVDAIFQCRKIDCGIDDVEADGDKMRTTTTNVAGAGEGVTQPRGSAEDGRQGKVWREDNWRHESNTSVHLAGTGGTGDQGRFSHGNAYNSTINSSEIFTRGAKQSTMLLFSTFIV